MPSIILPSRWTRQPRYRVEIDGNNQLSRGLAGLWLPTANTNLVNNVALTVKNGGPVREGGPEGVAWANHGLALNGTASPGLSTGIYTTGETALTIYALFSSDDDPSSTGYGAPFQSEDFGFSFHHANATFRNVIQAGQTWVTVKYPTPSAGQTLSWCGVLDGSLLSAYSSGGFVGSAAASTTPRIREYLILSRAGDYNFNGKGYLFAVWPRALQYSEAIELTRNPWQIFKPHRRVRYFDVPSGGPTDYPAAAAAGTVEVTGSAASAVLALNTAAAAGSVAVTGTAAAAALGLNSAAGAGTITITGSAAEGLYTAAGSVNSAAAPGSVAITGGAAAAALALNSAASTGSITITGSAASGVYAAAGATTLTAADLAAIWGYEIEPGITALQALRILLAAVGGKRVGLGTATEYYMAQDGVTPRITFSPTDTAGNGTPTVDGS